MSFVLNLIFDAGRPVRYALLKSRANLTILKMNAVAVKDESGGAIES
ncbi:MAG: hypothetical protein ACLFQV_06695 [Vulcanimicrobiota bacterium]